MYIPGCTIRPRLAVVGPYIACRAKAAAGASHEPTIVPSAQPCWPRSCRGLEGLHASTAAASIACTATMGRSVDRMPLPLYNLPGEGPASGLESSVLEGKQAQRAASREHLLPTARVGADPG